MSDAPTPAPVAPTPTGILVIDKPLRMTSMDVCAIVRGKLRGGAPKRIKVGHGGTLDPLATGVLVVLVGKATPLCNTIMAGEKAYLAEIDLSVTSPTDDMEGPLTHVDAAAPSREAVERACAGFVGTVMQRPPAFSAMKVGGRRAYDMARAGQAPELAARPVEIHEIAVQGYEWPRLTVAVRCGKGTYIRSLARDLGAALGTGGCLAGLRRTRVGRFGIEAARTMESLPWTMGQGDLMEVPGEL